MPEHGCAVLENRDDVTYVLPGTGAKLAPGGRARLCPAGPGVHRVQLEAQRSSGGFVIVDPEA